MIVSVIKNFVKCYESMNSRRFVTGLLFGCGLLNLFFLTTAYAFRWAFKSELDCPLLPKGS